MKSLINWMPIKRRHAKALLIRTLKIAAMIVFGGFTTGIIVLVIALNARPDLKVWHEARLNYEFTESADIEDLAAYLALEDRLFSELRKEVYDQIEEADKREVNRYHAGSLSDPGRWPKNWNRTWVAEPESPQRGVLLLHGMSDSPYSMRSLGERIADEKTAAIALRIPGHGTSPSGLLDVEWEDMAAAVKIAVTHLKGQVGNGPIAIIGYSNGGALAIQYALSAIENSELPQVEKIVLLSPSIGVTKLAALAIWQSRLGRVLGLKKLAWNVIQPEYDPYKYGSFALNAGHQVYRLTSEIRLRLAQAQRNDLLKKFPPVLGFQSVVDATVSTPALVDVLFDTLPEQGHELVLFDINRLKTMETVFSPSPTPQLNQLTEEKPLAFRVTVLENVNAESRKIMERSRAAGSDSVQERETDLEWPPGIYSLSHVALPFPETDALYGGALAEQSPGIQIGNMVLRGESGVLQIPANTMLRQRWNPFYYFMEERIVKFLEVGES